MTDPIQLLLSIYVALVGMVTGSYLNVVIHRVPRGASTVRPRSLCPGCSALIHWYDNVPILSYLVLRARCRNCGAAISARYPAIEALTGAAFVLCFLRFGASLSTAIAAVFVSILIALACIDAEHFLLPNRITYPGLVIGLIGSYWATWTSLRSSLLAAAGGAAILSLLILVWLVVRKQQAMGWGDPKMLAMIGAFLGVGKTLLTLLLACVIGTLVALILMARGRADWQSHIPFGVFLAIGAALALFWGDAWIRWYLGLY